MDPVFDTVKGAFGHAEPIPLADTPEAVETVCSWLITAPMYHPLWSQYVLCVVRLRDDVPGFPPPTRQFAGTTHELLVLAIKPDHRWTAAELGHRLDEGGSLPYLTPVNIAQQFIASDDEMRDLASLASQAVVHGALGPETADAPERVRQSWLTSLTKTLAHLRGEAHAS